MTSHAVSMARWSHEVYTRHTCIHAYVHTYHDEPRRFNGTLEPRSVHDVELDAVPREQSARGDRLGTTLGSERDILPAREEPELVVSRLAVPDDDDMLLLVPLCPQ